MSGVTFRRKLAEVLTARLCHELVNPLGAVVNGVEVMEEDPAFAAEASVLIATSARQAATRLQFYRLAYGATAEVSPVAAERAMVDFFTEGKIACVWPRPWPEEHGVWVKTMMNLAVLAVDCLPRGGEIRVVLPQAGAAAFVVRASGTGARLPEVLIDALDVEPALEDLTPRTAHAAFTAVLAREQGGRLAIEQAGSEAVSLRLEI
jgi:histidine phosphotransferase ChpT